MSSAAAREPDRARAALEARLGAFRRYAELLHAQLEALEAGDLARVEELTALRQELAEEIGAAPAPDAPRDGETERMLAAVWQEAARCAEADGLLVGRLQALRRDLLSTIRELEARRPMIAEYLQPPERRPKVDIRL